MTPKVDLGYNEAHWHITMKLWVQGRARHLAVLLRDSNTPVQWASKISRVGDHTVVIERNTAEEYCRDSHSALFHTLQLVWDKWPEGAARPGSRIDMRVTYHPEKKEEHVVAQ